MLDGVANLYYRQVMDQRILICTLKVMVIVRTQDFKLLQYVYIFCVQCLCQYVFNF